MSTVKRPRRSRAIPTRTLSGLGLGQHTFTVQDFDTSGNLLASNSYTWTITSTTTPTQAPTDIVVATSTGNIASNYGDSVTYVATVSALDSTNTPEGVVNFYDGSTLLGSGTLNDGVAMLTPSAYLSASTHVITATYGGDANDLVSTTQAGLTLIVAPKNLTVTATSAVKTYGDADPAFNVSYDGFAAGEGPANLGGVLALTTNEVNPLTAPVASYTITASGLTSSNYTIKFVAGILTVNPAPLTVTAVSQLMAYGSTVPTLTYTYSGLVAGDTSASFNGALSTDATSSSPVGAYGISQGNLAASGNYAIGTFNAGTLTVNPALLTVTADSKSMTYGGTVPALTYTYSGLVSTDTSASFSGGLATNATSSSNVGGYSITQGDLAATGNYTVGTFNTSTLTVTPALLTVTATAASMTYGGTVPALTYTYSGLANSDTTASFSGALTTNATSSSPVGGYGISQGTLAATGNYTIGAFNTATLTVTPALLTVTAVSKSMTYGGTVPALTYTYIGQVNGTSPTFAAWRRPIHVIEPRWRLRDFSGDPGGDGQLHDRYVQHGHADSESGVADRDR